MAENKVVSIIMEFIKAIQGNDIMNDGDYSIKSCSYLFGQIVRQWKIPEDHYFVSQRALDFWNKLGQKSSIFNHRWRDPIKVINLPYDVEVKTFKGATRTGESYIIHKGTDNDWFFYRQVFHDEHIVCIGDVIDKLISLKGDELNENNIVEILNSIYICKMLKEEDRNNVTKRSGRGSLNYKDVIKKFYKGIVVLDRNGEPINLD